MKIQAIRGMNDIAAPEIFLWQHIEQVIRDLCSVYGFTEIRTPVAEPTTLFKRGVGEGTDIVEKEMYTFQDRGGEDITLRPEGTAPVVRAVLEHSWLNDLPVFKVFYLGPMFRYERPQKGRYRQFYQFGLETFGSSTPRTDVEVLALQTQIFERLGVRSLELRLSSLGCQECRPPYKEKLLKALEKHKADLCADCQRRIQKNPLRVLDCKNEQCKKIAVQLPMMLDNLCQNCQTHFDQVQEGLKNLKISYIVDPKIVRGLDYYTRTTFEFVSAHIGAQGTVCGGGRYDNLVEQMGGPATPAIGLGMGIERLALLLQEKTQSLVPKLDVFGICADDEARPVMQSLCEGLRARGIKAEIDLLDRGFKPQIKKADKLGAAFVLILGSSELQKNVVILKEMSKGTQIEVPLASAIEQVANEVRQSK